MGRVRSEAGTAGAGVLETRQGGAQQGHARAAVSGVRGEQVCGRGRPKREAGRWTQRSENVSISTSPEGRNHSTSAQYPPTLRRSLVVKNRLRTQVLGQNKLNKLN